jgi:predicted CXXCH cytochrome family protein
MIRPIKRFTLPSWLAPVILGLFLLLTVFTLPAKTASAAPPAQDQRPSDESCLFCHQEEGRTLQIGADQLALTVDASAFTVSVHGEEAIRCVDCHSNIDTFPHPEVTAASVRAFVAEQSLVCKECHEDQSSKVLDSVHQQAFASGNLNAATCADCHNPHTQARLTDKASGELLPATRQYIPQTCAQCHSTIFEKYAGSVHGSALSEGNPDVPTCIDCHGVHNISDPTTNTFRNSTPGLCASCHTDEALMNKYGLSTNVLTTYVADFHGTTVQVFEENFPDQPTNKPVCTDCHGIHDIIAVDDPKAGIAQKTNLLAKCQQCHPDASTEAFTDAWLSHYEPSPEIFPLVYYVNLFYKFFIPAVLGGMVFYILTDIYRRFLAPRFGKGGLHK